jgi:hypothetical protein
MFNVEWLACRASRAERALMFAVNTAGALRSGPPHTYIQHSTFNIQH